jgi:hypothetical protein
MESAPGFVRASRAWDADALLGPCEERVFISKFRGSQRVSPGELLVEWTAHSDSPEFRVRQAGLELMARDFAGLLRHVARMDRPVSGDDFCALLMRLGYSDMTVAERPPNVVSFSRPG